MGKGASQNRLMLQDRRIFGQCFTLRRGQNMNCLKVQREDSTLILTLNRPDARNALSPQLMVELDAALEDARMDTGIRAVIIAASGDKVFCAGGDLKLTIPLITGARTPSDTYDEKLLEMTRANDRPLPLKGDVGKPVIAAVEGAAMGGGLELVLSCDMIVSGNSASFAAPEVVAGAYPARLTFLLPQRLPYSAAAKMLMAGTSISAEEADRLGMLTTLTEAGRALDTAKRLASRICDNAPISVRETRNTLREVVGQNRDANEKLDRRAAKIVYATRDAREGPRAFAEKRRPVFTGE
ncbi:MAG: hypothetical protein CBD74_13235 [Saprospirales bacterium TMED214]|nr:MAG: hypothetical protein CBD74_13235 [Saprospirales bacterium TMED214]